MITRTDDLVDLAVFHAGVPATTAEHALRSVLGAIGAHLGRAHRQQFSDELPSDLASSLEGGEIDPSIDIELVAAVCRALAEVLSHEVVRSIREDVPDAIGRYFVAGTEHDPEHVGDHTLAAGNPAHAHSVAAENPHGTRKLSSARRAR